MAETIIDHLGKGRIEITDSFKQLHEANLLQLNCDKAHQLLGWHPRWNVEQTLSATALWYKNIMAGADAEQITKAQLYEFFPELK